MLEWLWRSRRLIELQVGSRRHVRSLVLAIEMCSNMIVWRDGSVKGCFQTEPGA